MQCMLCDTEGDTDTTPQVYAVEKPHGRVVLCEWCDGNPRRCEDCEHRWMYRGNADRPTCPACKGKRTPTVDG